MFIYRGEISSKPRMTQRDSWKKRTCVVKYYSFKDNISLQAKQQNFTVHESIDVVIGVQMPKSWSKKRKIEMEGMPHQQRPDIDNYEKSILDSLCEEDSYVHILNARKVWFTESFITIKNNYGKEGRFDCRLHLENNKR
jgi:Holliday junction resolvase RusA-like endonuclease